MKVLVIDDTQKHLDAAIQTLEGHDTTVCATHDEAVRCLAGYVDEEGNPCHGWVSGAQKTPCLWDAVLCDLLMPVGCNSVNQSYEGKQLIGQEMAVGWSLALSASKAGAKFVAVVTDMNHHNHPASAMLDDFNRHIFNIDGAKVLMTNYVSMVGIVGTECTCKACNGSGKLEGYPHCYRCDGSGIAFTEEGKNWGKILKQLMGESVEE